MSKGTPQDLIDLDFIKESFGYQAEQDFTDYLQRVLDRQAITIKDHVGEDTYNSVDPATAQWVVNAEVCAVAIELNERIINRLARSEGEEVPKKIIAVTKIKKTYEERLLSIVKRIDDPTGEQGYGFASGVLVTDNYGDVP